MRTARPLLSLAASLILTACSSADVGHDPTAAAPGSPSTARDVTSDARVEAYLDSLYDRSAVVHSFTTRKGDVVDCLDYAAEPGVRALVAKGATVDAIKASMRRRAAAHGATKAPTPALSGDAYVDGSLDDEGNARVCPTDTVPHPRVTREQIEAAGGLDAYRGAVRHQPPSPPARAPLIPQTSGGSAVPAANPAPGGQYAGDTGANGDYGHVFTYQLPASGTPVTGGISTMVIGPDNIYTNNNSSFIDNSENHSLAQIWIVGNGSQEQTLEVGWEMDATYGGPYLFVATSQESYQDFCENGRTSLGTTTCVPWVPNPDSGSLYAGAPLTMSVEGGAQHELTMQVAQECDVFYSLKGADITCSWDVFAAQDSTTLTFLGSLPNTGYGTGPLSTGAASYFETGGEVLDLSWTFSDVTMGEASLFEGLAFYGSNAYVHDFGYYDAMCTINRIGGPACPGAPIETSATVYTTQPEFYYNVIASAGSSSWTNWFYYGNIYYPRVILK